MAISNRNTAKPLGVSPYGEQTAPHLEYPKMPKNIVIRPIERFDSQELSKLAEFDLHNCSEFDKNLNKRVRVVGHPLNAEGFKQLFVEDKCRGFVIENQRKLIGYLIYQTEEASLRIKRLSVNRDYRKMGYGKTLIDNLYEKSMLDGKRRKLIISISEKRFDICSFFAHLGFSMKVELSKTKSDIFHYESLLDEIIP